MAHGLRRILEGWYVAQYGVFILDGLLAPLPLTEYVSKYLEPHQRDYLQSVPGFSTAASNVVLSVKHKWEKVTQKVTLEFGLTTKSQ